MTVEKDAVDTSVQDHEITEDNSSNVSTEDINIPDDIDEVLENDRDESSFTLKNYHDMAISSFAEAKLEPKLQEALAKKGWEKPTAVQGLCLPHTVKGHDVAGFAQTGTGKTGAFLISAAQRMLKLGLVGKGPSCIILAPTRELAIQIEDECEQILGDLGINSLAVYGGIDYEKQAHHLKKGVDIIVATPGRLKDYVKKRVVNINKASIFICDEVDRMFEMGFIEDVEYFLDKVPEDAQKLFFSATTNENVKELCFEYLDKPHYIAVTPDSITSENVEQFAYVCETTNKLRVFMGLLKADNPERGIIFTNTKLTAAWLAYKLKGNGFNVDCITGDLPQRKRIGLVKRIKTGQVKLLIATDVASRGLHIANISHVYNFDLPGDPANYVHRIGRTARAGLKGKAISLVCDEYATNFTGIQELLGDEAPACQWFPEEHLKTKDKAGDPFLDNFGRKDASKDNSREARQSHGNSKERANSRNKPEKRDRSDREDSRSRHGKNRDNRKGGRKDQNRQDNKKRPQNKKHGKPSHSKHKKHGQEKSSEMSFGVLVKKVFGAIFGSKK